MESELRTTMIKLAIEHSDVDMLERLHAREVPQLYSESKYPGVIPEYDEVYRDELLKVVLSAGDEVHEYFRQEFEIGDIRNEKNVFMFPFIGEMTEELIRRNNVNAVKFLEKILAHDKQILAKLTSYMQREKKRLRKEFYDTTDNSYLEDIIRQDIHFSIENKTIKAFSRTASDGFVTNIAKINAVPKNCRLSDLIENINAVYDEITVYADKNDRR